MSVKIPTAENLLLKIEDGFTETGPELMADSSDHKTFTSSGERFSLCASDENGIDRRPVVRPDGIRNGCLVLPAVSGSDDALDISAGTAWIAGSSVSITTVTEGEQRK